jgi:MFS transporter, DHA1 family, multidrug resistance protein
MDPRHSKLFILLLVAITAIGPLAMQIFVPALPAIQVGFGVPVAVSQLAFSLSTLSIAVSTLICGPLSDRFGRMPVLQLGLGLFLAGSGLSAVAPDIVTLIVGRIVQAAGGAAGMAVARAMVRDLFDREDSASMLAYLTMAMVVAPMLAPALGGLLIDLVGWRANFVFVGLVGIVVAVGVARHLRETRPRDAGVADLRGMLRAFTFLLRSPAFRGYAFQGAFSLGIFFSFLASAPYVMVGVLGRPATEYGLYFMMVAGSFMAANFVTARIARRVGVDRMILVGSCLALAGTLVLLGLVAAGVWTPLALFLPTAFTAFAQGLAMASGQAGALSVEPRLAGAASGLAGFLQMGMAAVVAQVVGMMQNDTPYPLAIFMVASAALALLAFVLPRELRQAAMGRPAITTRGETP